MKIFYDLARAYPGQFSRQTFKKELARNVIKAWKILKQQQLEDAQLFEIPIAQVAQFIRLGQIDTKKSKIPQISDMCVFNKKKKEEDEFPPQAAAILIALLDEGRCPELAIGIMDVIKEAAKKSTPILENTYRALRSDCKNLWIIAPVIKENKVNGIVVVNNGICGNLQVRDIDKRYYTLNVFLPPSESFAYIEERELTIQQYASSKRLNLQA